MALNAANEIVNNASGIVVDGAAVRGGYFVIDDLANIPSYANVTGALCYCTGTSKFYQYSGSPLTWKEITIGGGGGGGTTDYTDLTNKPSLDGITLSGDVSVLTALGEAYGDMQSGLPDTMFGFSSGGSPILVSSIPGSSVDWATTSTKGVMQVGTGLSVNSGTVSLDSNYVPSGTSALNINGTATSTKLQLKNIVLDSTTYFPALHKIVVSAGLGNGSGPTNLPSIAELSAEYDYLMITFSHESNAVDRRTTIIPVTAFAGN